VQPIGSSQGSVNVAGRTWDLWVGYNGAMKVFSFVAPSPVNSFSANVKDFFNYLQNSQGYPASNQNLIGEFSFFTAELGEIQSNFCARRDMTDGLWLCGSLPNWYGAVHRRSGHPDGFAVLGQH
jgi:hypothetical protein